MLCSSVLLTKKACENLRVPKGLVLAATRPSRSWDCIRLAHPCIPQQVEVAAAMGPRDAVRSRDGGGSGLTGGGSGNAQAETRWL